MNESNKKFGENVFKKRASALLISFFLMSILIVTGIGISAIVIRDIGTVRTILNGVKAAYAAEGMSELGLLVVKEKLPGYEILLNDQAFESGVVASLDLNAREELVPCEDTQVENSEWRNLLHNESVQLALFYDEETGIAKIEDFVLSFYLPNNDSPDGNVLRWKILGLNNTTGNTEAISDYISISGNTDSSPTSFDEDNTANFYQDYYFYEDYIIGQFLDDHDYNYLILTNVVQLPQTNTFASDAEQNSINFKLTRNPTSGTGGVVCEYAVINSVADLSDVRQSVKTLIKEGENLPVFDFALYHTGNN